MLDEASLEGGQCTLGQSMGENGSEKGQTDLAWMAEATDGSEEAA